MLSPMDARAFGDYLYGYARAFSPQVSFCTGVSAWEVQRLNDALSDNHYGVLYYVDPEETIALMAQEQGRLKHTRHFIASPVTWLKSAGNEPLSLAVVQRPDSAQAVRVAEWAYKLLEPGSSLFAGNYLTHPRLRHDLQVRFGDPISILEILGTGVAHWIKE